MGRRPPYTTEENNLMRELRDQGQKWKEISQKLKRSAQALIEHNRRLKEKNGLHDSGRTWPKIAVNMGRSQKSRQAHYHAHTGTRTSKPRRPTFSPDEENQMARLIALGRDWEEIGKAVDRTGQSCKAHWMYK